MEKVRLCARCHVLKSTFDFLADYKTCQSCRKYKHEWYEKNKSRILPMNRAWHKANPEKHKAANQRFHEGRTLYQCRNVNETT